MLKRQRLLKAILVIVTAVSVFLADPLYVYASENDSSDDSGISAQADLSNQWVGTAVVSGGTDLIFDQLVMYDNTGAFSDKRVLYSASGTASYAITFSGFEAGKVYNGQIRIPLKITLSGGYEDSLYRYSGYIEPVSSYDGISIGITSIYSANAVTLPVDLSPYIYVNFSNFHASSDSNLFLNFNLTLSAISYYVTPGSSPNFIRARLSGTSYDYTGSVFWKQTTSDDDSQIGQLVNIDSSLNQQITQNQEIADADRALQESIAAAQASQSADQHNEALHGFDTSQAESNQSDFNNSLSDYESQENAILSDAMTNVDAVDMDVSFITGLVSTFSLIRTVFMAIVTALGDFGILITITLTFALALFAIGWFRGGD